MKRSRFSEEQIIGILKEHESGVPVAELCRKHGVSDASIYKWKAKYGGMDVSEAKRLKALEEENAKLKRMLADAMLDNVALKDLLGKMYGLPRPCKDFGRFDKHSLLKCIRPLASGLRLQPGHDEIRTRRSQLTGSCKGTLFCTGFTVRRSTVSSSRLRASQSGPGLYASDGSRRS